MCFLPFCEWRSHLTTWSCLLSLNVSAALLILCLSPLYSCSCSSESLKRVRGRELMWHIRSPEGLEKEEVSNRTQSSTIRQERMRTNSHRKQIKTLYFYWLLIGTERRRACCDLTLPSACSSHHRPSLFELSAAGTTLKRKYWTVHTGGNKNHHSPYSNTARPPWARLTHS